ncbi:MAG TPA: threonine/serine exporter family protein, partial [Bdellovibrionota bacterium]|nr:threonine/serine exporter family protein [Bdellovibrionota bacterium]
VSGALTPAEGSKRISRILGARDRYAPWLSVLCQGISSAAISVFFRAGFWDVAVAFVLGLGVGLIGAGARRFQGVERLREALAAFAATLVASLAALALPKVSVPVVVLAGLISQFPGLTLTIAMSELATDNLVSGTARLMQAVATLLKLVFGAALGARAAELLGARPWIVASSPAPAHWIPLAVISASLTAVVLFRARPRDTGWVVLAGALAYVSAALGQQWLGPRIGAFAGGWALGAAANLFARIMSRPATLMVLPGLLILVPGSLGYRSLSSLFDHDVITGMDTAFTVVVVAASIVAGLLFGNVMVSPRRSL